MRYGLGLVFSASLRGGCYFRRRYMHRKAIDACWSSAIESSRNNNVEASIQSERLPSNIVTALAMKKVFVVSTTFE
jgi:hypothetical protein